MIEDSLGEIEFVFFDLGNILLSFDPNLACENVARRFAVTAEEARQAIYDSGLQHRFERGQLTGQAFAEQVRSALGRTSDQMPTAELLDAVSDMFVPVDSMPEALQAVRDAGLPVGLLSNTCHAHWDWIRRQRYPATEFPFDVTILSYEVGAMKPDAAIYEAAEQVVRRATGADSLSGRSRRERGRCRPAKLARGGMCGWSSRRGKSCVDTAW